MTFEQALLYRVLANSEYGRPVRRIQQRQEHQLQPSNRATTLALMVAAIILFAVPTTKAFAQKIPTATEPLHVSVFGGGTGVRTGFGSSKNLDITAGLDVGFIPYRGLHPSLEVRGSIAIDKGHIDSQKNVLAGLRLGGNINRLHPYGDVLFGRAQITYPGAGAQVPGTATFYTSSSTWAIAGGGGADYDLTRHFALKVDAQLEQLATPVTPGHIHPYTGTVGVVYTIGGGWRRNRHR